LYLFLIIFCIFCKFLCGEQMSDLPGTPKTKRSRGAPRGQREWSTKQAQVADGTIYALAALALEAASMAGQAKAISGIAESCIEAIRGGDTLLAERLLISIRELTVAQQQTCVAMRDRAGTTRTALVLALAGEYGEG
jgi:hypothetical protein